MDDQSRRPSLTPSVHESTPYQSTNQMSVMPPLYGRGLDVGTHSNNTDTKKAKNSKTPKTPKTPGKAHRISSKEGASNGRGLGIQNNAFVYTFDENGRRNSGSWGKATRAARARRNPITEGVLYPPATSTVDVEYGLIMQDRLPPLNDLRPYTMRPTAILKKLKEDIEQGKRLPRQHRRLTLLHPIPPIEIGPDELACMSSLDHIFFKTITEIPEEMNIKIDIGQRVVVSGRGRFLYLLGETRTSFSRYLLDRRFKTVMRDLNHKPAITFIGHQRGNCGYVQVSIGVEPIVLGTIEQDLCDSTYIIKDEDGRIVNRVQGPCYGVCAPCCFWCFKEYHQITESDGVTDVGKVQKSWKKYIYRDKEGLLGLSFPTEMPTWNKALLVGFLVLIHFQYYHRGGNGLFVLIFSVLVSAVALVVLLKFWLNWF